MFETAMHRAKSAWDSFLPITVLVAMAIIAALGTIGWFISGGSA